MSHELYSRPEVAVRWNRERVQTQQNPKIDGVVSGAALLTHIVATLTGKLGKPASMEGHMMNKRGSMERASRDNSLGLSDFAGGNGNRSFDCSSS